MRDAHAPFFCTFFLYHIFFSCGKIMIMTKSKKTITVVYANEAPPKSLTKSIFLAGPTPRSKEVPSWRPEALRILEKHGYDGVVFVPETSDGKWREDYVGQVEWEERCLNIADCILFWVPREMTTMPALTTNSEWGMWQNSGKVVFGAPLEAVSVRYQRYYAEKLRVPHFTSLEETILGALEYVGDGALRIDGERDVPLYIWETPHFQAWYAAQKGAGNRLDGAKVEWTFRAGPQKKFVFFWALHVNMHITKENRNKTNEVVIGRPDVATIVMYRRGTTPDDSDIVLVREFRSPASTEDGFVWEVPGGSSFKPKDDQLALATDECYEETGLRVDARRMRRHESRQMVATLSSHKAHLFSVEITDEELAQLRSFEGVARGVLEDSERTYVEILKLSDIRKRPDIDWSVLGMILSVLTP